jgi:hypothetical protein
MEQGATMEMISENELETIDGGGLGDWFACGAVIGLALGVAGVAIASGGAAAAAIVAVGGEAGAAAWAVAGASACANAFS